MVSQMNKLRITPEAARDLSAIKSYITSDLQNPIAAQNVIRRITKTMRILQDHAMDGVSQEQKTGYETDLRMLSCADYLILYRANGNLVTISRVVNGRQDYITELFGDDMALEETRNERLDKI